MASFSQIQTLVQNITGAPFYNVQLTDAERTVYSRMIQLAAMPLLRFDQFSIKKTELTKEPGLSITLTYWNDLPEDFNGTTVGSGWAGDGTALVTNPERKLIESNPIETEALSMVKEQIWVGEYGRAVAGTRLASRTAYLNWLQDSIPILARDYAKAIDHNLRNYVFGCRNDGSGTNGDIPSSILRDWDFRPIYNPVGPMYNGTVLGTICVQDFVLGYDPGAGSFAASKATLANTHIMTTEVLLAATEKLAVKNVAKLPGDYWGCILHPHQLAQLKLDSKFREAVIYGDRGAADMYNGVIGVYDGIVFFESSRCPFISNGARKTQNGFTSGLTNPVYGAIVFGDEFLARAIALDGELVTDGVHDFGREIKIGWYGIWGQKALRPFALDRAVLVYTA